jgi:hypothetical protein
MPVAAVPLLDPFDLYIAPVGFTGIVDINVMNAHCRMSPYSIGTKIECRI